MIEHNERCVTIIPIAEENYKIGPATLSRITLYSHNGKKYSDFWGIYVKYVGGFFINLPGWFVKLLKKGNFVKGYKLTKKEVLAELEITKDIIEMKSKNR